MTQSYQYKGNVWIWETTTAYRREVALILDLILTTTAGKTLVKHINSIARTMLILPFKPTREEPVNAYAYPTTADRDKAHPLGYVSELTSVDLGMFGTLSFPSRLGTGEGASVQVDFHPATYKQVIKNKGYIAPGDGPGEVLFHEMLHGFRMMSGKLRTKDAMGGNMDDVEEFRSIMAQNVYRAERGFTRLRKDHHGHAPLPSQLSTSSAYYLKFKNEIDKWFGEQPAFCLDMADVPAWFNPFDEAAVALGKKSRTAHRVVSP